MLRETIFNDLKQAMKNRESEKLSVLRYMISEIKNVEIDAKHELSDQEILGLLRKEVKRRSEALVQYQAAHRDDIVDKEQVELDIIQSYMPAALSETEVETVVDSIMAQGETDFGTIMKQVMAELSGKADGSVVSQMVRKKLSS